MFNENEKVTPGQCLAIIKLCEQLTKDRGARLYLLSKLFKRKITTTKDVKLFEWRKLRNFSYPDWSLNDWSVSLKFIMKARHILKDYEEKELGQLNLFTPPTP